MGDSSDFEAIRLTAEELMSGNFESLTDLDLDRGLSRLGQQLSNLGENLEQRVRESRLLAEITERINLGLMLDEVLNHVFESFRPVIPYDRIGYAQVEEDGRIVRARWARSDRPIQYLTEGFQAPLEGSSLQRIIHTGEPRILNDLELYLRDHPESASTRMALKEGILSSLTCPLLADGRAIGFLFFSSEDRWTYDDAHVELFVRVARQLSVIVEKSQLYQRLADEQRRSNRLLRNVLPAAVADALKDAPNATIAHRYEAVTVLFADIVGFTERSARLSPGELVELLGRIFSRFDDLTDRHGVEKIKTIGDAYLAVGGLPEPVPDHADRVIALARAMQRAAEGLAWPDGAPLQLRIGVHTGPAAAGVVGRRRFSYDVWGDAVNVASRLESTGRPGRIHLSAATRDALCEPEQTEPRGLVPIKGKGVMETWFVRL